uniref:Uncharacterized protein n=1 Tax=Tetraselmis sp. GSL018 TaxID=582737 RepID=A0A061SFR3_9CHLO
MAASAKAFHLQPEAVDLVLSGLVQHVLVALPQNLTQAAGIRPNVSDRFGPKCLWVGRMRHLCLLLRSEGLRKATDPRFIRDSLRQQAQQCQSSPVSGKGELIKLLVHLIELPSKKLEALARGVVAVQKFFRHRRSRMRRRKETAEEMDLAAMQLLQTAFQNVPTKGYVIYLCGSTGIVGDSFRYLRMMAGMGYVVLAPDMMVSAAVKGSTLRTRQPKACMLLDSAASDYWSKTSLYADNSACAGEMVYSSKADSFMSNPEDFNRMYSNIITLRQAELAHVLRLLPLSMRRLGVTLIGSSEGAVVLSSFQDEPFADIINGRVILAYPCEPNYWTYFRPEDAGIAGDAAIPTLNLVGCDDQYFGRRDSVAAMVAQMSGLPPVRGHALEAMAERGCTHGLVCHFEGAVHTLLKTHDSVVREVLASPASSLAHPPVPAARELRLPRRVRAVLRPEEPAGGRGGGPPQGAARAH